eukprot:scaffold18326_cov79-Skeletonema_marinoi.AAC.4
MLHSLVQLAIMHETNACRYIYHHISCCSGIGMQSKTELIGRRVGEQQYEVALYNSEMKQMKEGHHLQKS